MKKKLYKCEWMEFLMRYMWRFLFYEAKIRSVIPGNGKEEKK